jgi:hypothetical protein
MTAAAALKKKREEGWDAQSCVCVPASQDTRGFNSEKETQQFVNEMHQCKLSSEEDAVSCSTVNFGSLDIIREVSWSPSPKRVFGQLEDFALPICLALGACRALVVTISVCASR